MNKQNTQPDTAEAEPGLTVKEAAETTTQPGFGPEQLPDFWQRIAGTSGHKQLWRATVEALYERCETYPQYAALAATLSRMPDDAWYRGDQESVFGGPLVQQATPEQLIEALKHEHRSKMWKTTHHVLLHANDKQLTGPVIEQLEWDDWFHNVATGQNVDGTDYGYLGKIDWERRVGRIVEHIQQRLLRGNQDAWDIFCGVAGPGNPIGETAELALAIEQQNRPS